MALTRVCPSMEGHWSHRGSCHSWRGPLLLSSQTLGDPNGPPEIRLACGFLLTCLRPQKCLGLPAGQSMSAAFTHPFTPEGSAQAISSFHSPRESCGVWGLPTGPEGPAFSGH